MQARATSGHSWRVLLWVVVVALLGAGGFAAWQLQRTHVHKPGEVPLEPVAAAALREDVRVLSGLDEAELAALLEADPTVVQLAELATAGKQSAQDKAQGVVALLAKRKQAGAFSEWSRVGPRLGAPLTAAATGRAIAQDAAERQLYPLELAALGVAALRSAGVPALVAEVFAYPGDTRPLDPSGHFGYFAVFVPENGGPQGRLYDVYLAHTTVPSPNDVVVLNDAQAVGAALGLRAMDAVRNRQDLESAHRDAQAAVKLLPGSPTTHGVLASVLLTRAEGEAGKAELDKALALRADAPRRNNLALHALTGNDPMLAGRELGDTLKEYPDFAYAHTTRAAASMILMAYQIASDELQLAEKADPQLALVPQLRAQLLAAKGDLNEAVIMGRKAVQQRPSDPQPLFILARIERSLGLKDDMRKHAAQIMELTPLAQREGRKLHLQAVLGEDAFDGPAAADKL